MLIINNDQLNINFEVQINIMSDFFADIFVGLLLITVIVIVYFSCFVLFVSLIK
jgi:hypothetical protein